MERISRKDDENKYQPRIHATQIRELYLLKEATGIPMTVLLSMAIARLLDDHTQVAEQKTIYEQGNK